MSKATETECPVTLRYFAWVREKSGLSEERVTIPPGVRTVRDLLYWQRARGDTFAIAFERPEVIRVALDHVHARPDALISGSREIGFFPPVTGG